MKEERAAHPVFFSVQDYYIASLKSLFVSMELSNPMTLL